MSTSGDQLVEARSGPTIATSDGDIFALLDDQCRIIEISDVTRRTMGMTDDSVLGENAFETVHPTDVAAATEAFVAAMNLPGVAVPVLLRARPLTGRWRTLDLTVTNQLDVPGVGALLVTGRDVTDERRRAVVGSFETHLLDTLPTSIVVTDDDGIIHYWNARATELFGYTAEEAIGRIITELAMAAPTELRPEVLEVVRAGGRWEGEYVTARKDGSPIPVLVTLERVEVPEIGFRGVLGTALDNSERRSLQLTLAHQALHDPLTGLPNRALFLDRLERAQARLRRNPGTFALLFIDLDRFKLVNDSCGHQAGDEVLRSVAELLGSVLRPEDTVARLGGDEFAVCCERVDGPADAMAVAERLTRAVSHPFVVAGRDFYVTPSIGIVLGTGAPGETASSLLSDADAAMYHAKERGRGRIELFDQRMRLDVLRRAEVTTQLRHAVDRDELVLHYQPMVDLTDGKLTGFEALLRWNHPERGVLRPGEFIDVAEETNLIVPMGAWVIREATRQLAAWRDELPEHPITISVNLSARQIADPDLVPIVRAALADNELEPSRLCLEITESVLMDDAEGSVATLRELKAIGVQLAIDDFGTGYSSLAYLKRFPVDYLKIDRSFVTGVDHETEDAVIVKAVVELGHALGLAVVAEGVETDLQLAEVRRVGCDQAQGYRWAVPCPPAEALRLVAGWHASAAEPLAAAVASADDVILSTTELLSVLTHELVTPLTVVKGQCERLAQLVADLPTAAEVVAAVARNAERIEHLVATLADAHQLEAGTLALRTTPFDLVELVHDVLPLALPEDRPVAVVGDPVVTIEADGRRLEQVLVNLLTNAHKFSPLGAPILVTVEAGEHDITVVVADEGPGVPPERVADIFRKFARLERSKKGVGLGLFISRCLARAHGGDLHHRRHHPVGSEFVLTLPQRAAC